MESDRKDVQAVLPTPVKTQFRPWAFYSDGNVSVETCKSLSEHVCHAPSNGEEDPIGELCEMGSCRRCPGPG